MTARVRIPAMLVLLAALPAAAAAQRFEVPERAGARWYKGNTHAHTLESDGDSPPAVVARWYKDHGYHFLVLSDHNVFTDPRQLSALQDSAFILIGGEELTSQFQRRPVHVNGLNIPYRLDPATDSTLVGTIQKNVDAVRRVAGLPHINHPNFGWAYSTRELLQIRSDPLLEIWNGHPLVHNEGGDDSPGMEAVWDALLSAGKRMYGIAVDDAHHFQGEFARDRSNPGRGWVAVRANALEPMEIMRSLERGAFYASTGPALADVVVEPTRLTVIVQPQGNFKYTVVFIGDGGRELARMGGTRATFTLDPTRHAGLTYVRARVDDSGGGHAWVQPTFVRRDAPAERRQ